MEHEVILDNQKYISSRDAAKQTGYAQDYIGQLCRAEKVTARRVGRSWFVEEASLHNYIETQKIEKERMAEELRRNQLAAMAAASNAVSDTESPKEAPYEQPQDVVADAAVIADRQDEFVSNMVLVPVVGLLLLLALVGFAFLLDNDVVKRSNLASAVSPYNGLIGHNNPQESTPATTTGGILEGEGVHIAAELHSGLGVLLGSLETLYMMTENLPEGTTLTFVPTEEYGSLEAVSTGEESQVRDGLVVVPSIGEQEDRDMIEFIRSSFSDEVIITPDEDNASGIIQPVFRNSIGKDYLYVVVPIRD